MAKFFKNNPYKNNERKRGDLTMFTRYEGFPQFTRNHPITTLIVIAHVTLFLIMYVPFIPYHLVFRYLAGVNILIDNGEYWRLLSPIFVHNDFTHLLFNSFSVLIFAPFLERSLGKPKFLISYLTCGIAGNLATFFIMPPSYTHVGASGAIFGLLGMYLGLVIQKKEHIHKQNQQTVFTIITIGIIMTFLNTNINITAHLFGLLIGFIIGLWMFRNKKRTYYYQM